jgi:hypothetical protein
MLQQLVISQQGMHDVVDANPFHVTPLESVFALEYLLPQEAHGRLVGATTPHQKHTHKSTVYPSFDKVKDMSNVGELAFGGMTTYVSASTGSDHEFVEACGGVQFVGSLKCGEVSDWVCGGRQVEPRLGYLPYKNEIVGFPAWSGFSLPTTIDQFLANASARVTSVNGVLQTAHPHNHLNIFNTMCKWGPSPDRGSADECVVLVDPASTMNAPPHHGRGSSTIKIAASLKPASAYPTCNKYEEEAALIRASLARTMDVMKVASFLGMAPLVELCGLVIAILLRGSSPLELRETLRSRV